MTTDKDPPGGDDVKDLALELNFVPDWAKDEAPNVRVDYHQRDSGRRSRTDRDHRPPRGPGSGKRPPRRPREAGGSNHRGPSRQARPVRRAPVRVDFMPDRARLGKVVHLIRQSKRAYDIHELANRFMASPSLFSVKFMLHHRAAEEGESLFQYKPTQQVFMQREACVAHAMKAGLAEYFDSEEVEGEAPAGQFPCVGRCRLGGELLGPPNHHSYATALADLCREKYPNMTPEQLKKQVEMIRDPEVIESWREASKRQVRWRPKQPGEASKNDTEKDSEEAATELPLLTTAEAEKQLRAKLDKDIQQVHRAICSGAAAVHGEDERIVRAVETAALAEREKPKSMLRALQPALKHMRLTFFSAGGRRFVTAVPPEPLHGRAVEEIEQTIGFLKEHPGASRNQLLEFLSPGKTMKDGEVVHELSSLRWLIDKGHVIEFFDGSLALPAP